MCRYPPSLPLPTLPALLPASRWRLHRRSAGIIIFVAPASTPLFHWHCHPCHVVAIVALTLLLSLHPRCRQHHACVFAGVMLALLPSLCSCTPHLPRRCCCQHRLRLLLCRRLLLRPSQASHPADCHVTSPYADASHLLAPQPLLLVVPSTLSLLLLCLLSGWLSCCFSSRCRLQSSSALPPLFIAP